MRKLITLLVAIVFMVSTGYSQNNIVKVKKAVGFVKTAPLSTIQAIPTQERDGAWKIMKKMVPNPSLDLMKGPDPTFVEDVVLQSTMGTKRINTTKDMINFEGVNNVYGYAPPDNHGDVGPGNYLQMINVSFAIFSKTGRVLYGPADNSTLWSNLPGPWSSSNDGDPIVMYDELAGRWFVSQFALPNFPNGPFYELVGVSASNDPLGSWYLYAFEMDDMPDYPKFGVWPDAYYMSVNSFSAGGLSFIGAAVAALERDAMIAGDAGAQMIFYQTSGAYSLLPADLDGTAIPPAGTPGIFTEVDENGASDRLLVYNYMIDWSDPSSSVLVGPTPINVANFSNVCSSRDCVPQAGTSQKLDALSGRLMTRLQYRYFSSTDQRMVTNHTVDNGSGVAAVRWYELRRNGANWSLYQQGTYSPDNNYRWMASAAMDINGNIALGYSVSSSSITPEIRFTGRYVNDPLGEMTITEETIFAGPSSQTGVNRWGDYTNMTLDPTDNATFWYTNQYSNGSWDWGTRIAGFTFEVDEVAPAAISNLAVTGTESNSATLSWTATGDDGTTGTAARYDIRYRTSEINSSNWASATSVENTLVPQAFGFTESYTITGLGFGETYYFAIKAIDNLGNESEVSNSPSGSTDNPPVASVSPSSLSSTLFTGGTEEKSFSIFNGASAGSSLEYLLEIVFQDKTFPKKELTPAQIEKSIRDNNKVKGNGVYPTMYVLGSKDEYILQEAFENGVPPADWTVVDNAGTGVIWKTNTQWGDGNVTGGTGESAACNSDAAGVFEYDTELITPSISVMGRQDIYLSFKAYYNNLSAGDFFDVDITTDNGATWTTVLSWNEDHTTPELVTILIDDYLGTSASSMKVRFHYYDIESGDWNWDVQVDDVEIVGGSAWLVVNPTSGVIPVGGNQVTDVTFSANGLVGGTYNANVLVVSNDPVNPILPVTCTLDVTGVQNITVDPTSIDFGTLFVNEQDIAIVTVSNTGTDDLNVSSLTVDNTDYSLSDANFVLTSGQSKDVTVYFMPTHTGADNGTLTIVSDDPDQGTVLVTLTGEGSDAPVAQVTPTSLSANLLTGQTSEQSFNVANIGTTTSLLDYYVSIEYGSKVVIPQKQLTKEQLQKSLTDVNQIGNGKYPTQYVLGRKDDALLSEAFENGVPPTDWTVVDNAGTGVIWKTNTQWGDGNVTGGTGESAACNSDAAGHLEYDTELITPSISVMGRQDLYLSFKVYYSNYTAGDFFDVDITTDNGETWTTVLSWNEDHTTPEYITLLLDDYLGTMASSMKVRFHYYDIESGDWNWDVQVDDVEIVGGSAWLAVSPLEGQAYNGTSNTHNVTFSAAGMFGGTYNANIVVNTNDPLNSAPAIACQLDVTGVQDIDATPTAIDFGTIFVNGTKTEVVTVYNLGTDNLAISGVSVDNTEYTVTNYAGSLAPGESTDLLVTFAPTSALYTTAVVTISSDDPDETTFTINLSGNAVNPPIIGVTPTYLHADLTTGESSTQQFTISNTGESALDFSVEIEETMAPLNARISKINLPKSDGNFEKGTAAPSLFPAPKNNLIANGTSTKDETVTGYAANLSTEYFQNFDVTNPGTLNDMFAIGSFFAGAITPDNSELAYAIDYNINHLWLLNLATGVVEDLGSVAGLGGSATGMEYVGNTCYVVTYTGAQTVLQTLDVESNSVTTVGSVAAGIIISLGKDGNGELFALNLSDDMLYHVDASTGVGTAIGSVGFDANYAQGMGYDPTNDVLYLAAFNNSTGFGELRVADTETGNTLAIGTLGAGDEMDMLTFIGGAGSGDWLTTLPLEGIVPSGGSLAINVTFDAEGLVGGDYAANINVYSNDPVTPVAVVEATMDVTGAPNIETEPTSVDFGNVFVGYHSMSTLIVSNTGTDDLTITGVSFNNPIFGMLGITFPITLTSGTSTLFDITASSTNVGNVSGVLTISSNDGNEPSKQVPLYANFILPPVLAMDLSAISGYTEIGGTTEVVLNISNNGGSELSYGLEAELLEKSNKTTTIELEPSLVYINEKAKHNLTTDVPARTFVVNNGLTTQKSSVNVLVLSPDTDEYISELMAVLTAFDDLTVTHYPLDGLATLTSDELLPYDVVLSQNDLTWEASLGDRTNVGNVLADYIDAGGKVVANMYLYSYDGWGLAGRFITEGYGPFVSTTTDIWGESSLGTIHNPNHPLMSGVYAIDDNWGHQDPSVASGADLIADWADGEPMIAVNENVVGLNLLPINGNSSWASDLATLLHNSIIYLGGSSWLTIDPSEGVVNAGSSQEVTFTMNSEGMSEGTYYGTLHVFSNDPTNVYSTMDITFGVGTEIGGGNGNIPSKYELSQNYPNPFNPSTNIIYALPVNAKVTVKIFDVLGREVRTLVNKQVEAGTHSIKFNGINLTSGVYFYAIRAEGADGSSFVDAKKFILMK